MKGEYSLNVSIPVSEAVKSVMVMPGSAAAEGIFFSGRIKKFLTSFSEALGVGDEWV